MNKSKMANVRFTRWAFYEAYENGSKETMTDWFETLYYHYQQRGKKIKELRIGAGEKEEWQK